jgi:demethylmenaquinone methyltransferase/2-methoxy-6-polyprenyl-1,4-benzoquinol methylase
VENVELQTPSGSALGKDAEKVKQIFEKVAIRYDRANSILSLGIHHLWRKKLVSWSSAKTGFKVLDCATGTGDLALEFKKTVGSSGTVIGTDFCAEMISLAPGKAEALNLDVNFKVADVLALPFEDNTFDVASISFGIRNVADPKKAISELFRILKPGGKLMILEFGQPENPLFGRVYEWYSKNILPKVGGAITGYPEAYAYLEDSSAHFPCRSEFLKIMRTAAPFFSLEYKSLSLGIAYMYKGVKPAYSKYL